MQVLLCGVCILYIKYVLRKNNVPPYLPLLLPLLPQQAPPAQCNNMKAI